MPDFFWLFIGGGLGTLCRYTLGAWGQSQLGQTLPYGTLLVNLLGCLLMGVLAGWADARYAGLLSAPPVFRLFFITGFLGGFTTFSSYELEVALLVSGNEAVKALLYCGLSTGLGLLLVLAGFQLGRIVVAFFP